MTRVNNEELLASLQAGRELLQACKQLESVRDVDLEGWRYLREVDEFLETVGSYKKFWEAAMADMLAEEALKSCSWRGHRMKKTSESYLAAGNWQVTYECQNEGCIAFVQLLPEPQPNQIDIGGTAVALNCPLKVEEYEQLRGYV